MMNALSSASSQKGIEAVGKTILDYKRLLKLFYECGESSPERFIMGRADLSNTEKAAVYFLKIVHRDSMNTVKTYARNLCSFFEFAGMSFDKVQPMDITEYAAHLRGRRLKARTIDTYLASVTSFYKHMLRFELLDERTKTIFNALLDVETKKSRKTVRGQISGHVSRALSLEQMDQLRDYIKKNAPLRDTVLIEFLYSTGARAEEASQLRWEDIYFAGGEYGWFARLHGKGSKDREVYLREAAMEQIWLLRRVEHGLPPKVSAPGLGLLPVFHSRKGLGAPMTYNAIYKVLRKWGDAANLNLGFGLTNISPHWLRHTFATHAKLHGASLEQLQTALGHEDMATTKKYLHVDDRLNPAGKVLEK